MVMQAIEGVKRAVVCKGGSDGGSGRNKVY